MNPDSENFDQLRRLLALKRHEQPPPGYFQGFSSRVISRISAGERGETGSMIERLIGGGLWLWKLRNALEARPAFAGAFGAAVCALLLSGVIYSENLESTPLTPLMAGEATSSLDGSVPLAMNDSLNRIQFDSGTNSITSSVASLFDQVQLPVQRVGYLMPGGD